MQLLNEHQGKVVQEVLPQAPPSLAPTVEWLIRSGIQPNAGYFFAWNDSNVEQFCYPYPEITGYGATAMCFLQSAFPHPFWLRSAESACDWLIEKAMTAEGGVHSRFYFEPHPNRTAERTRLYAFDSAMAGFGLLNTYSLSKKSRHLEAANRLYQFLTTQLLKADGTFHPFFDEKTSKPGFDPARWSGETGGYHAKLALFFLALAQHGVTEARDAAERLLDATAASCLNGKFLGNKDGRIVGLHPHAYTLEGLVYGLVALRKEAYVDAIAEGYGWLKKALVAQGDLSTERTDVIAQALRLALVMKSLGVSVEKEWVQILHRQLLSARIDQGSQKGAWRFRLLGEGSAHANCWTTLFALQALAFIEEDRFSHQLKNLRCFI